MLIPVQRQQSQSCPCTPVSAPPPPSLSPAAVQSRWALLATLLLLLSAVPAVSQAMPDASRPIAADGTVDQQNTWAYLSIGHAGVEILMAIAKGAMREACKNSDRAFASH